MSKKKLTKESIVNLMKLWIKDLEWETMSIDQRLLKNELTICGYLLDHLERIEEQWQEQKIYTPHIITCILEKELEERSALAFQLCEYLHKAEQREKREA